MANLKWGLTAAAAAFFISVSLGFISGVAVFHIFIRALIFTVVFFGIGFAVRILIDSFIPELLHVDDKHEDQESFDQPASRIDITLDTAGEYAVPELYKTSGNPAELGNIEDLMSGHYRSRPEHTAESSAAPFEGVDRNQEAGYNNEGGLYDILDQDIFKFEGTSGGGLQAANGVEKKPDKVEKPVFTPKFGDDSAGLGGLPDLELMAMAFSGGYGSSLEPSSSLHEDMEPAPAAAVSREQSHYVGNKPQPLKGDFDAKELAKGIRTVLSKEK